MRVAVFGGASPRPEHPIYQDGLRLGALLAQTGCAVITGGYGGLMEAVSRGAAEAGGHVIGATCTEIESWRGSTKNQWVNEEWRSETLMDRLTRIMDGCDAAIALPGGPGTLVEISLFWNRMLIESLPSKPLILIGSEWQTVMVSFLQQLGNYIPAAEHNRVCFVPNIEQAVEQILLFYNPNVGDLRTNN